LPRRIIRDDFPEQQLHPAPCVPFIDASVRGAWALRSFVAWASRACGDIVAQCGAVRMTRGACDPHFGHSDGNSHSAIGRIWVNGPHALQRYS
jgi:hypothetical protein